MDPLARLNRHLLHPPPLTPDNYLEALFFPAVDELIVRCVLRERSAITSVDRGATEPITEAEIETVFGPQGAHIVVLLQRVQSLSFAERETLDRVGREVSYELPKAYRDVPSLAPPSSQTERATSVCLDVRLDEPRRLPSTIAWHTTEALSKRDQLHMTPLGQRHYDTLTDAWRTHIGPIHPDDPPPALGLRWPEVFLPGA